MKNKIIDDKIEELASMVLEYLSQILPDVEDEGALGELVLQKALDTYILVGEQEL